MAMLEIRELVKHFGGLCVTNHVTCDFPEGKITSVIGPNGAGKNDAVQSGYRIFKAGRRENIPGRTRYYCYAAA